MITKRYLISVAKDEIQEWNLPSGLALAILFSFIYRVTSGEKVEELLRSCRVETSNDYQI